MWSKDARIYMRGARTSTIRLGTTREAGSGETTGLLHATTAELRAESGENGEPGGRVQVEADLPKGNVAGQVQDWDPGKLRT